VNEILRKAHPASCNLTSSTKELSLLFVMQMPIRSSSHRSSTLVARRGTTCTMGDCNWRRHPRGLGRARRNHGGTLQRHGKHGCHV